MRKLGLEDFAVMGYQHVRQLANGEVAALYPMIYTTGLLVGLDDSGYNRRYCYERQSDAFAALMKWDGQGDPPGPWLKQKGGVGGERLGPGLTDIIENDDELRKAAAIDDFEKGKS
jgi:hypothetical protein